MVNSVCSFLYHNSIQHTQFGDHLHLTCTDNLIDILIHNAHRDLTGVGATIDLSYIKHNAFSYPLYVLRMCVMNSLREKLQAIETKQGVRPRWSKDSTKYKITLARLERKEKTAALQHMHTLAQEKAFLLALKRKYSGSIPLIEQITTNCFSFRSRMLLFL